ncbi:hypothetical protein GCM10023226_10160 [Nocardioides nanhaiensis]|uniref:PE domain-containing protein n=2 Tax=Nocardioides nanhaiensis TaxID=1476871 RepID=A0ABP8VXZ0_9ACTN
MAGFANLTQAISQAVSQLQAEGGGGGTVEVDTTAIETLRGQLDSAIAALSGTGDATTPASAFGPSDGGQYMAHHTSLAEQAAIDALVAIRDGITNYRTAVNKAEEIHLEADQNAADDVNTLAWQVDESTIGLGTNYLDNDDLNTSDG